MGMYASNAGKSGGEYYTPQEVSELLTKLTLVGKTEVNKVYDPACGSGSLLLKFAKILGKDNVRNGFFGQEINITTYNLCRINMFLHDIDFDKFDIAHGDTLTEPAHWDDEPFEAIVSNPPYSIRWEGDNSQILINDSRFSPAGVLAPKSKADLAFIMHSLSWLAPNGTAAIVCFPGVMYRSGAEQKIRKYLIDNNYIDCIIQLPDNLFYGTSIATCIMVMKKAKTDNKVLFIDASKEFVKVTNSNKMTEKHINDIVEKFTKRVNIEYISNLVDYEKIVEENYNLSVSTYVEKEDTSEKIDIVELNKEIQRIVAREEELRKEIDKIIAEIEIK
jgi:type I restriction-modification system, M subunit